MKKLLLCGSLLGLIISCVAHRELYEDVRATFKIQPVIQLGHSGVVQAVAISSDGSFAVSGSADGTLKFWELSTGRLIYTTYHHLNEKAVSAFRGGEVEYDGIALIPQVNYVDISSDGRLSVSGASDGNVVVTEIKTGKALRIYHRHSKSVNITVFSKDGNLALTGGVDGEIHLWQIATGKTILNYRLKSKTGQITALDISPDGQMILAGDSEGNIGLIDLADGHSMQILGHHSSVVSATKFSADGSMAVSGSLDGSVKLWGIYPRRELQSSKSHKSKVISVGFSHNSDYILSCSADGTVNRWNITLNLLQATQINHQATVYAAAFSIDDRFIITGSRDRTLKQSWISTGQTVNTFEGRSSRIHSVVFSPDGRLLLSSMRGQVNCWDMTTGRLRQIFKATLYQKNLRERFIDSHALSMHPNSIGFSPDNSKVVSLGWDGTYHIWDITSGKEIEPTKRYATKLSSVAYSPDKRYYARGTRSIHVRNTVDDRIVRTLNGHKKWITAIAYSPDGRSILSGDEGGNLILWNVKFGIAVSKFSGHLAAVTCIDFSAAGHLVATSSWDNTCRVWNIDSGQEIVKLIASPDGEWITSTPDGFYINSPEGKNLIHWSVPGELETYSFEQFESKFMKPDVIAERLNRKNDIDLISPDIAKPPRIAIKNQNEVKTISGKQYSLQVTTLGIEAIETLRVFSNGKPIHEISVTPGQTEFNLQIPLVFGVNRITAVAFSAGGFSSNPKFVDVVSINHELQMPNLHIYAVGISRYANMRAEWQLQFAHTDARAIIESFKGQEGKMFGSVSSTLLVNEKATADSIIENLCAIAKSGEANIFVIFMAGHGVKTKDGEYYFLGYNGTFDNPENDGVNWKRLKECLSRVKGRTTLFLDACHSGSIVNETVVPNEEMAQQFFSGERAGIMVFSASKGRQYSMESPDIGNGAGVFTHALCQGIGSNSRKADTSSNGYVEFVELVNYVTTYVNRITGGRQTPWVSRKELFGDMPIAEVVR